MDDPNVQIPGVAGGFSLFKRVQNCSRADSAFYSMGTGILSQGYSSQEIKLTPHPKNVPTLNMNRAIPLFPLYTSMVKTKAIIPSVKIQCVNTL